MIAIILIVLCISWLIIFRRKKKVFICGRGYYKVKISESNSCLHDLRCDVYKLHPERKIFKWGLSVYSMGYDYGTFSNTQELIKSAIKSADNKLKRQENYNKTKKEFWGK